MMDMPQPLMLSSTFIITMQALVAFLLAPRGTTVSFLLVEIVVQSGSMATVRCTPLRR